MKFNSFLRFFPISLLWLLTVSCQDKSPLDNYDPTQPPGQEIPSDGDDDPEVVDSNHPRIWITQEERP